MTTTHRAKPKFCGLVLGLLLASAGSAPAAEKTLAEKAAAAFAASEWQAAAEAYAAITKAEPQNGAAWFRLGRSQQALGNSEQALAAYETAEGAGFNKQFVRFEMARSHSADGSAETALELLREVATLGASRALVARLEGAAELASLDAAAVKEIASTLTPCSSKVYRHFDFWLGDWAVESPTTGAALGKNVVTSHLGGCMLIEHWTSAGGSQEGMSMNYFDSRDDSWNQIYLDDSGNVGNWPPLKGGLKDGVMVLDSPEDATPRTRWMWTDLGEGRVQQRADSSTDGGKTWTTVWDSIYVLQKE